jgi:hypothetical protein
MNTTRTDRAMLRVAGFVFAVLLGSVAHAQGGDNRGELMLTDKQMPAAPSPMTRDERKATTVAANRNGGLGSPGQSSYRTYNLSPRDQLAKSTKTRAEGKAEILRAVKDHKLMPAGEAI